MKTLKFSPDIVELILNGSKTTTWRLFDDKDIRKDNKIILIKKPELTPFAEAIVTGVSVKALKNLSEEDSIGHEFIESEKVMYKTYSNYYNREVSPETEVKIIRFEITKFY